MLELLPRTSCTSSRLVLLLQTCEKDGLGGWTHMVAQEFSIGNDVGRTHIAAWEFRSGNEVVRTHMAAWEFDIDCWPIATHVY